VDRISAGLAGKHAVVTGAGGYIGSALVDALVLHSCRVTRIGRADLVPMEGAQAVKADVRKADVWRDIAETADIVFHLAGNTSVYDAAKDPVSSLSATLMPIAHLVQAAQKWRRRPRVVFASTATVYGLTTELPVAETFETNPVTVYDLHKLFAEHQLAMATRHGVLDGVSLRIANVYGPSTGVSAADDRGILNKVTVLALKGRGLTVYGDGCYLRDYVYISDVVNAMLLAGFAPNLGGNSYNIASGVGTTISHAFELVAKEVAKISKKLVPINCEPWPSGADLIEFRNYTADINLYSKATGWKPHTSLREGISRLVDEYVKRSIHPSHVAGD
jgi:nucleoside-diphosphate-sugar epimerase